MKFEVASTILCAGLLLPGCALPALTAGAADTTAGLSAAQAGEHPKLYAHDGGVVSAAPPGELVKVGEPSSPPLADAGSRITVIELLQQAVEERDRLRQEVEQLRTALDKAGKLAQELEAQSGSKQGALASAEQERQRLELENSDLAARLATAQIRRLEAEKSLLESVLAASSASQVGAGKSAASEAAASKMAGSQAVVGKKASGRTAADPSANLGSSSKPLAEPAPDDLEHFRKSP